MHLYWPAIIGFLCGTCLDMYCKNLISQDLKGLVMRNSLSSLCVILMLPCVCLAANVEWNRMNLVDAEVWDTGPLWQIWG